MNTERLEVPAIPELSLSPPPNGDRTPSRRGHRHKRSFAISQDLDFVKTAAPGTPKESDQLSSTIAASSPQQQDSSLRFFMTEESTYSRDIPNAIIDLDEALTTKPKSFTSHRRAESAPAQLVLPFRLEPPNSHCQASSRIVEEEDSESDNEIVTQATLMSPLRAKSQSPFIRSNPATETQKASIRNQYNTNAIKINKQKERYQNYTKHFPAASPQALNQGQEPSFSSLSSDFSSGISTAGLTYSPTTPAISVSKYGNRTPSPRKTFNFQSQVYDLPLNDTAPSESPHEVRHDATKLDDDDTLTCTFTNATGQNLHRKSKSASAYDPSGSFHIPKEILQGQPGDSVDLAQSLKSSKKAPAFKQLKGSSTVDQRAVSDSAVTQKEASRKWRGKLNIFYTIVSRFKSSK
ncbi:LAFA_0G00562g1_1 [Lachancea sp. 'fantastica']|nr:LAFA_0G00562g1_1 [Lachancea sp. 'fantastica']